MTKLKTVKDETLRKKKKSSRSKSGSIHKILEIISRDKGKMKGTKAGRAKQVIDKQSASPESETQSCKV